MREVELKSVCDFATAELAAGRAGAHLVFRGQLHDRRYDTADRALSSRDLVLRLRVARGPDRMSASLDWKGPTEVVNGYKVREEISVSVDAEGDTPELLAKLGYEVIREIEREVAEFELAGAHVRLERYPRMDDLVEVEGEPESIERAISALGLERSDFTSERLPDFARRFELRTGQRAALSGTDLNESQSNIADA